MWWIDGRKPTYYGLLAMYKPDPQMKDRVETPSLMPQESYLLCYSNNSNNDEYMFRW